MEAGVGGDKGHERPILECGIDSSTKRSDSRCSDRLSRGCRTTSAIPDGTQFRGVARGSLRRRGPCREVRLLNPRAAKGAGGPRVGNVSRHRWESKDLRGPQNLVVSRKVMNTNRPGQPARRSCSGSVLPLSFLNRGRVLGELIRSVSPPFDTDL